MSAKGVGMAEKMLRCCTGGDWGSCRDGRDSDLCANCEAVRRSMADKTLGQIARHAYCNTTGRDDAWRAAAVAVKAALPPAPAPSWELVEFALERAMTFMRDSEFRAAERAIISALAEIARAKEQGR